MTAHRAASLALLLGAILCGCDDDKSGSSTGDVAYSSGHELVVSSADPAGLQVESEILLLTNQYRASIGLPALAADGQAADVARGHSRHMVAHDFFSHTNPEGAGPGDRLSQAGVPWWSTGENIAAGYPSPQAAFDSWLSSPGHRANIENPGWTHLGVGYWEDLVDGGGVVYDRYYTQVFIQRP